MLELSHRGRVTCHDVMCRVAAFQADEPATKLKSPNSNLSKHSSLKQVAPPKTREKFQSAEISSFSLSTHVINDDASKDDELWRFCVFFCARDELHKKGNNRNGQTTIAQRRKTSRT